MKIEFDKYSILLGKFFRKEATIDEIKELNFWISDDNHHQEFDLYCKRIWQSCPKQADSSLEKEMLGHLKGVIRNQESKKTPFHLSYTFYKIAISILIPLCIGLFTYILMHVSDKVISVPFEAVVDYGQKANLTLPDGTKVWLNSGSRLKYDKTFNKDKRTIYLDGEAYFEVVKNPHKRFIVSCNGLKVEALGTIFNVKGYHSDPTTTASLIEGSVKIYNEKQSTLLKPNEMLEYNKRSHIFTTSKIDDVREIDFWRRNILFFRSATLEEISRTLERAYGITIKFKSDDIKQITFSGSIRNNSLTNVFHIISLTYPISYKIDRDTITLDKD